MADRAPAGAAAPSRPVGQPPGLDIVAVERWLLEHGVAVEPPLTYTRAKKGRSNLTFVVEDAMGHSVILRRPPLGPLLQSAHDMGREFRILSALASTAVPVPVPLVLCMDGSVTGASFYVMS